VRSHPADDYEAALRSVVPVAGLGDPLRYLSEAGSTNDEALAWAAQGAPEGALVVADHQSAGRGRRGRTWHAPPGSALLFSLVLRPRLSPDRLGLLTTALGVAGAEAVRSFGIDARVKWPNDVTVDGRKLAGVLVESRLFDARVEAVAGMGLNVSVGPATLPSDVADRATSLVDHADMSSQRHVVLETILEALARLYSSLTSGDGAAKLLERASVLSGVLGSTVSLRTADERLVQGRALRLTRTGALVVATGDGDIEVTAGEIERLRSPQA
jgi:BirA family transcriptional regulator, biotin operon repressor / biotin---[acetyl-CoA-carboxylase] ligase